MQRQHEGRYLLILFKDSRMKSKDPSGKQDAIFYFPIVVWYIYIYILNLLTDALRILKYSKILSENFYTWNKKETFFNNFFFYFLERRYQNFLKIVH